MVGLLVYDITMALCSHNDLTWKEWYILNQYDFTFSTASLSIVPLQVANFVSFS